MAADRTGRSRAPIFWALIAIAILTMALIAGCGAGHTKTYTVPSEAMEPTYKVGEKVTVNLDAYADGEPAIGDVVVFHPPAGADSGTECGVHPKAGEACPKPTNGESNQAFLKRVVAGPGDTLAIKRGHAVVNGKVQDEPFAGPCTFPPLCDLPHPIKIPSGDFFMLGDNRNASDDSRFWGPVPAKWILGRVE
jgi:signal peptidase I